MVINKRIEKKYAYDMFIVLCISKFYIYISATLRFLR